ncbi:Uncharacterized protein TCAP_04890 [Tolypocladium capitatum]|uniref:Uncharacterized protein n=1 Tax=Tolypocladium capitatum TaxID=45235 RepID=A0A2K3QCA4_9HYPO|nr:Uncharacterized protein TCAP_04890 [Tolypocladium capitatum]
MDYRPHVVEVIHHSKNAIVARLERGIVLKYPRYAWLDYPNAENEYLAVRETKTSFNVEEAVLNAFGDHPRIVKFLGTSYDPRGLKFAEANKGNLQQYLDHHFNELCPTTQAT